MQMHRKFRHCQLTPRYVSASSTPKDLETMFQLNYLYFTSLRKDNEAFESQTNRLYSLLQNAESQPVTALQDSLLNAAYTNTNYVGASRPNSPSTLHSRHLPQNCSRKFARKREEPTESMRLETLSPSLTKPHICRSFTRQILTDTSI